MHFLDDENLNNTHCYKRFIEQSWQRCEALNLDPSASVASKCVTDEQLSRIMQDNKLLLDKSIQVMDNLYQFVKGSSFVVTLSDSDGVTMRVIGDEDTLKATRKMRFIPGYYWSEDAVGTNAISMVLEHGIPMQVFAKEHYCKYTQEWTCSAAPIFNKDVMVGVINMSAHYSNVQGHTLGMVVAAANAIEGLLNEAEILDELTITNSLLNLMMQNIDDGIIAVDAKDNILKLNSKMCSILGIHMDEAENAKLLTFLRPKELDGLKSMKDTDPLREVMIKPKNRKSKVLMGKCRKICDQSVDIGYLYTFSEMKSVKKLVNTFSGSNAHFRFDDIIGENQDFTELIQIARRIARSTSTVLLTGESGTGKELFAQAIHNESDYKKGPFIAINCGAIPRDLIESELFGFTEGAFTGAKKYGNPGKFELAEGGTIFLDEIGDMPLDMQVALLRVIERKSVTRIGGNKETRVDVRIIAATNKDLQKAVEEGKFREDLYYRLNVLHLKIIPLRERVEDIEPLLYHFIRKYNNQLNKGIGGVSKEGLKCLKEYGWPGNVRELENIIERAVNISVGSVIEAKDLAIEQKVLSITESHSLNNMERDAIVNALNANGFNVTRAAKELGIGKATIYRKMRLYNIERPS